MSRTDEKFKEVKVFLERLKAQGGNYIVGVSVYGEYSKEIISDEQLLDEVLDNFEVDVEEYKELLEDEKLFYIEIEWIKMEEGDTIESIGELEFYSSKIFK